MLKRYVNMQIKIKFFIKVNVVKRLNMYYLSFYTDLQVTFFEFLNLFPKSTLILYEKFKH